MPYELKALPYANTALEPIIDARTVEIHYTKHHATYLNNLNSAIEKHPEFFQQTIESLLQDLAQLPEDIRVSVKNNGGGYYNHTLYWENMRSPSNENKPSPDFLKILTTSFTSFDTFKSEVEKTGLARLGSGYSWLSMTKDGSLIIHSTLNQDCPLSENLTPLLVVDVWEHAYYLNYQNRRADYLKSWWNLVNWDIVEKRFQKL